MRDKLAWIGVGIIALGIVLPWATYSATLGGSRVEGTIPGYEYLQSFLALAIAVVGVLLGMKLANQAKKFTIVASGAIVAIVAASALADLSKPAQVIQPPSVSAPIPIDAPGELREPRRRLPPPDMTVRVSSDPHIGVIVTILGGLLLVIGGFTGTMRETE